MPAPALPNTPSLETLRAEIVFSHAALSATAATKGFAAPFADLLKQWEALDKGQRKVWDDVTRAVAVISAVDTVLDGVIIQVASAVGKLPADAEKARTKLYFANAPHKLAAPVLGEELEALRAWLPLLTDDSEASIAAFAAPLTALIAQADAAVAELNRAEGAQRAFRLTGPYPAFIEQLVGARDAAWGKLEAADKGSLLRSPRGFFVKRKAKVSEEAKAARAAERAEKVKAAEEKVRAVKVAQDAVKAAAAALRAARGKRR